jgi:hypothetical protein
MGGHCCAFFLFSLQLGEREGLTTGRFCSRVRRKTRVVEESERGVQLFLFRVGAHEVMDRWRCGRAQMTLLGRGRATNAPDAQGGISSGAVAWGV